MFDLFKFFTLYSPEPSSGGDLDPALDVEDTKKLIPEVKEESSAIPVDASKDVVLKQVKLAEAVSGKADGGVKSQVAPGLQGRSFGSYGGDVTNISADFSSTGSSEGDRRSDSRFGRKLDPTVRSVDDLSSELTFINVEGAVPLNESPDSLQGGRSLRPRTSAITSKENGVGPMSPLYHKSVDEIRRDEVFYGAGQNVKMSDFSYNDTFEGLNNRGDYIPKSLSINIDDGVITDIGFNTVDITSTTGSQDVLDAAAKFSKTFVNKIELLRRKMNDVAGDESKEGWSPLPNMVKDPNKLLSLLKDLETDTGNYLYAGNRFAKLSHAYQINRTGKDGIHPILPLIEGCTKPTDFSDLIGQTREGLFNHRLGAGNVFTLDNSAFLVSMQDSVSKYKTKGDFLNLPRSLKMLINAGNTNVSGVYASPVLVNSFEKFQSFSTTDGSYDGVRPVLITDNIDITTNTDWSDFTRTGLNGETLQEFISGSPLEYRYYDLRTEYGQGLTHPIIAGLYEWFRKNLGGLQQALRASNGGRIDGPLNAIITVPVSFSLTTMTPWQFLLNAAAHEIRLARSFIMRDILAYEDYHGYPFSDLILVDSKTTTNSENFVFQGISESIKIGKLRDEALVTWLMPELFSILDEKGSDEYHIMAPWYFSEETLTYEGFELRERFMNWPFIRNGFVHDSLDLMRRLGEERTRYSFDLLVTFPYSEISGYYKYDNYNSGVPIIEQKNVKVIDMYKNPRELGLRFVKPGDYGYNNETDLEKPFLQTYSYSAKIYRRRLSTINSQHSSGEPSSITPDLGISATFSQEWYYYNSGRAAAIDDALPLSAYNTFSKGSSSNGLEQSLKLGSSAFSVLGIENNDGVLSNRATYDWVRLQILPFGLSPFDTLAPHAVNFPDSGLTSGSENTIKVDPFGFLYVLGFAGFDTSDYGEAQYVRLNKENDEAINFIEDFYIEKVNSLI